MESNFSKVEGLVSFFFFVKLNKLYSSKIRKTLDFSKKKQYLTVQTILNSKCSNIQKQDKTTHLAHEMACGKCKKQMTNKICSTKKKIAT